MTPDTLRGGSSEPQAPASPDGTLTGQTAAPPAGPGTGRSALDPLLQVTGLSVSFPHLHGDRAVVDNISFDLHAGEILALVGQSGSGKSVTARTLVGLAGDGAQVQATRFRYAGRDLSRITDRQWRSLRGTEIGFVLQDALTSLDPLRRIGQEVAEPLGRIPRAEAISQVESALREAGIPDPEIRRRQYPHQLSGGLRQRALIASALVNAPRLVIADEPTTALDVTVQKKILALLRGLVHNSEDPRQHPAPGILLITHDLAVVSELADRVLVMHQGRIVESGPTSHVLSSPAHEYTRSLMAAVPGQSRVHQHPGPTPDPPPADLPLLGITSAQVSFAGPRRSSRAALTDVSIEVRSGETLGLVGESGSGKSTLGRVALGLQPVEAGSVTLFGQPWHQLTERDRLEHRSRIQLISQDPLGSFDPLYTVHRILDQPLRLYSSSDPEQRRAEAIRLLELVGLEENYLQARPRSLSGGQRQRVAIAQALAPKPDLLIADEPVSALDVITQAQVLQLLANIQQRTGLAMLFISHDLGVVRELSHRVAVLKDGVLVETGDTADIFRQPQQQYTQELLAAVPRLPWENQL